TVSTTTCAPRWWAPNAGKRHFRIANRSGDALTMYLFHPRSEKIVASAKHIRAHTTRRIAVTLKRGEHLVWGCYLAGRPSRVSDVQTVPMEHVYGGHGKPIVPLTRDELVPAMKAYRTYVVHEIAVLTTETNTLAGDLGADDVAAAKADWLTAHLTWLRI